MGAVTADEFRSALATMGYSQSSFAREHKIPLRTIQRWASGRTPLPGAMVAGMNAMLIGRQLDADYKAMMKTCYLVDGGSA